MGVALAGHDLEAPFAGDRDMPVFGLTVAGRSTDHQFLSRLKLLRRLGIRVGGELSVACHCWPPGVE